MPTDPDAKTDPLRDDVRRLGAIVGDMLRQQEGDAFFDLVESTRLASQRARQGDGAATLQAGTSSLDLSTLEKLVRAFSAYFGAVNMGEQIHRIRRRRAYEHSGIQPNSPLDVLGALKAQGFTRAQVREALSHLALRPVFTAHPTEAVRRTLLTKQQRIARALVDRIEPGALTPAEERRAWDRITEEVHASWQTEEHFRERPTLDDETGHVLFYLSQVIYRIVPSFMESLESAFQATFGEALDCPALLRFGSWVGGDMDGNPNVNATTIEHTLQRQRDAILQLYMQEAQELADRLSQSESRASFSAPLLQRKRELSTQFSRELDRAPARHREMPYRVMLHCMIAKLRATRRDGRHPYGSANELLADVALITQSVADNKGAHAGLHHLLRFGRRIQTFQFFFATLDVRQDSEVHRHCCAELLGDELFSERHAEQRTAALSAALSAALTQPGLPAESPQAQSTMDVFKAIARARRMHGADAIGPYIISMAQAPDDMLAVLYLARQAGLTDGAHVPLDVAPLFETVADLQQASSTLEAVLANAEYRRHLAARGNVQHVMLGYSDSGKDSSIGAARWALYRAQEQLVACADRAGVQLVLFHGRGGTVSRGGTKVTEAIPAQPPGSVRHRLRVTEQGEIIHSRYGLRGIAQRTLEVMAGAVLGFSMREPRLPAPGPQWCAIMQTLADESRRAYRALVHDDPRLFAYFQSATPVDVISRMHIGSRPPSRRAQKGIGDLRAIPWVFAWTQSRLTLPGWYGMGHGLRAAIDKHTLAGVQAAARDWPVLRVLLSDVEMVMAKADLGIATRYAALADAAAGELFGELKAAFESTRDAVLEVRGQTQLLEHEPWLARAIRLRNPYIDPMSLTQIDLLEQWRAGGREDTGLERALFTTVKGIARGLLNTG